MSNFHTADVITIQKVVVSHSCTLPRSRCPIEADYQGMNESKTLSVKQGNNVESNPAAKDQDPRYGFIRRVL